MTEFREFTKIPRLSRECTLTEKLDGSNASIFIGENGEFLTGSRQRWITPENDNYGFSRWAHDHEEELRQLGPGHHFGEWWGKGIQCSYGLDERRFSLFNTSRWADSHETDPEILEAENPLLTVAPRCCHVVPVLYQGVFSTLEVERALNQLVIHGSRAAHGFMKPEGVVVFHHAAGHYFKKTCEHDDEPKNAHQKKERRPQEVVQREPQIMWTGGRRQGTGQNYTGTERRIVK